MGSKHVPSLKIVQPRSSVKESNRGELSKTPQDFACHQKAATFLHVLSLSLDNHHAPSPLFVSLLHPHDHHRHQFQTMEILPTLP